MPNSNSTAHAYAIFHHTSFPTSPRRAHEEAPKTKSQPRTVAPFAAQAPLEPSTLGWQQSLAQSARLRQRPVINCDPSALPQFGIPSPRWQPVAASPPAGGAGLSVFAGGLPAPSPKPQPFLPCWNEAAGPEQIPMSRRKAQHPLPQSAELAHSPPMNCSPAPLPFLWVCAGSGFN